MRRMRGARSDGSPRVCGPARRFSTGPCARISIAAVVSRNATTDCAARLPVGGGPKAQAGSGGRRQSRRPDYLQPAENAMISFNCKPGDRRSLRDLTKA